MFNRIKVLFLSAAFLLTGCAAQVAQVVQERDLAPAIARGEAVLGSEDALVVCYKALDEVLKAQSVADEFESGLLLDAIMRARILRQVREKVEDQLRTACSEIVVEVLVEAGKQGLVR